MLNDVEAGPIKRPPPRAGRDAALVSDEPLDPEIERIRRKLSRLMVLGIGTLLIGVLAVFGVILYRSADGASTPVASGDARVPLVAGARLEDASLAANGLLLRIAMPDGSTQLLILDPASGEPRLRVTVGE